MAVNFYLDPSFDPKQQITLRTYRIIQHHYSAETQPNTTKRTQKHRTSAATHIRDQEALGSNPGTPTSSGPSHT